MATLNLSAGFAPIQLNGLAEFHKKIVQVNRQQRFQTMIADIEHSETILTPLNSDPA
jgi:hypothetical protein